MSALCPDETEICRLLRAFTCDAMTLRHGAVEGWDAGAVGVAVGVTELGGDAGLEALGDEVFQALGLVVQLVQVVVEHAMKEGLDETVMADDLEGTAATQRREADAAVALVVDKRVLGGGELLQHVGDGGGRDFEALGQCG